MGCNQPLRSAAGVAASIQRIHGAAAPVELRLGPFVSRRRKKVFRQGSLLSGIQGELQRRAEPDQVRRSAGHAGAKANRGRAVYGKHPEYISASMLFRPGEKSFQIWERFLVASFFEMTIRNKVYFFPEIKRRNVTDNTRAALERSERSFPAKKDFAPRCSAHLNNQHEQEVSWPTIASSTPTGM